jgi:hypothetical protein
MVLCCSKSTTVLYSVFPFRLREGRGASAVGELEGIKFRNNLRQCTVVPCRMQHLNLLHFERVAKSAHIITGKVHGRRLAYLSKLSFTSSFSSCDKLIHALYVYNCARTTPYAELPAPIPFLIRFLMSHKYICISRQREPRTIPLG